MANQRDMGKAVALLEEWRKTTEKGFWQFRASSQGWDATLFPMVHNHVYHDSYTQKTPLEAVNTAINKSKGMTVHDGNLDD